MALETGIATHIFRDLWGVTVACTRTGYISPEREQPTAKKRIVGAVARKLAVLLLTLWNPVDPTNRAHYVLNRSDWRSAPRSVVQAKGMR